MKKKKSPGGASWMDTYGDMVTLLLCFFVLLYSISTVTEEKWVAVVKSFDPKAVATATETSGGDGPSADGDQAGLSPVAQQAEYDASLNALYESLSAYVSSSGAQNNISVTRGEGYVFISFNQAVFFDGDSWVLREESLPILDEVSGMLNQAADAINEVQVLGHTAQAEPNKPNDVVGDRTIASNRANVVTIYIQEHAPDLPPGRLVSVSYGQHRPVADNSTREGRAQNRRVEMIVSGKDVLDEMGDSVEQYYTLRGTEEPAAAVAETQGVQPDQGDDGGPDE